jgi:hypothetical protein
MFLIATKCLIDLEPLAIGEPRDRDAARVVSTRRETMIRNYKAFGLALMAMFAFSAIAAQGASAVPLTVDVPEKTVVHLTGDQETAHKFTTPNGTVSCSTAVFDATPTTGAGGAINEITVAPTYTGCSAFGFATAHVTVNGCTYTFETPTKSGSTVTWGPSQIHILCSAGKSIEITPTTFGVSACTQFVGEQSPTEKHVVGVNAGGAKTGEMDITLETTLEKIHYTGTGGLCGNSETHSDAKYTGNSTVKCYKNPAHTEQVDCTFS